jgi:AhpC/TSA antioxidant enzyme
MQHKLDKNQGNPVPKLFPISQQLYLTQRGGTFLFDAQGNLLYEHRDRGILGFAANMSRPLSFLLNKPAHLIAPTPISDRNDTL